MPMTQQQEAALAASASAIRQTEHFMGNFALANPLPADKEARGQMFDSLTGEDSLIPEFMRPMFDSMDEKEQGMMLTGIKHGIDQYKALNGGEEPTATQIAFGLSAGTAMYDKLTGDKAMFDSLTNQSYNGVGVVPAMSVVTISNCIAYSLPIVAMLPNPTGSMVVPLVYVRYTSNRDHLGLAKGDFIDGSKSGRQYVENRPKFKMAKVGATNEYTATCRQFYSDYDNKVGDAGATALPFKGGQVDVTVNGYIVANDRTRKNGESSGTHALSNTKNRTINGVEVSVVSSSVNLDTHTVSVTFANALPVDAVVQVKLVLDFERKDAQDREFLIIPPGVSISEEFEEVHASEFYTKINVTEGARNQMQNELGLPFIAASTAMLQQRYFFEQNIRLLEEAKDRAIQNGRVHQFDASRGVSGNMAAAYNKTGDLIAECLQYVKAARTDITRRLGQAASGYTLFVDDSGANFFSQMGPDNITLTGADYGMPNSIVRIGTLQDGTDVYFASKDTGILTTVATSTDMVLVARSSEAAKSVFVGHMPKAPSLVEASRDIQEKVIGQHGIIGADINPIDRYGDQCAVIKMINLVDLRSEADA